MYTVRVVGDGTSVGQGCTVCTTSPCFYVQQVSAIAKNITISVAAIDGGGASGSQNSTTIYGESPSIITRNKQYVAQTHTHNSETIRSFPKP